MIVLLVSLNSFPDILSATVHPSIASICSKCTNVYMYLNVNEPPLLSLYISTFIRWENATLLHPNQTLPLWLNDRQGKWIFALFLDHGRFDLTSYNQTKLIKNDFFFYTSSAHMKSVYVYLLKVSSDMQQCLQFTSPMWRQHCEYFIDFWFCVWIESLSWILCPLSFFLTSPDKQRFKEYLCSYTWFYIYLNNPDEDLHMEWVCISDDVFVQTGKFYIFATWLFLSFLYVCNE